MIFGNPEPMPDETYDQEGLVFDDEVIEITPGSRFINCRFTNCGFSGYGPFELFKCVIVTTRSDQVGALTYKLSAHLSYCVLKHHE